MTVPGSAFAHTTASAPVDGAQRRVRHEVRDGIAVMAFSLLSSMVVALLFLGVTLAVGN